MSIPEVKGLSIKWVLLSFFGPLVVTCGSGYLMFGEKYAGYPLALTSGLLVVGIFFGVIGTAITVVVNESQKEIADSQKKLKMK
jgi:hypothetical protein